MHGIAYNPVPNTLPEEQSNEFVSTHFDTLAAASPDTEIDARI